MTSPPASGAGQSSGLRTAGRILLLLGGLALLCGAGFLVAYYVTSGFQDTGSTALADLGYGSVTIAAGTSCCGLLVLLLGLILAIVGRRR